MYQSTRRQVLLGMAATGVTGLSGCTGESGPWYELSLTNLGTSVTDNIALHPDDQSPVEQRRVADALANGTPLTTYGWRPFDDGQFIQHDGVYYQMTVNELEQTKTQDRSVVYGRPVDAATATDAVSLAAFPDRDQRALRHVVKAAASRRTGTTTMERVPNKAVYVLHGATPNTSGLLPTPDHQYIKQNDHYYQLVVETRSVTETAVETTFTEVAQSEAAFEQYAQQELVAGTLSKPSLSSEAMSIVRTAIEETYGYDESVPLSEAYVAVLNRCGYEASESGLTGENSWGEQQYVRYEGEYYRAQVTKSVA